MRYLALLLLVALLSLHAAEAAPKKPPPKKAAAKKPPPKKAPVKPKPKAPPPLGKLSCNIGCLSRNRAIVPKTQVYQLAKSLTSVDCLRNAYLAKKGFQFYQWVPGRSTCYAFKDCSYTKQNTAVLAGTMKKCPKLKWPPPPPPIPTYCSALFKGVCRRCPRGSRCENRDNGNKACCCPTVRPNPIIKRGRFAGCQA